MRDTQHNFVTPFKGGVRPKKEDMVKIMKKNGPTTRWEAEEKERRVVFDLRGEAASRSRREGCLLINVFDPRSRKWEERTKGVWNDTGTVDDANAQRYGIVRPIFIRLAS
jgi:hypothetical protein